MAISKITNSGIGAIDTLTVDTDTLVVDSTNNRVGVGTASPSSSLYVLGDSSNYGITSEAPNGYGSVILKQTSGNTMSIGMSNNGLFVYDGNAATTRLTLDSSGNLLVNNTTARGKITVHYDTNSSATPTVYFSNDGGTGVFASFGNSSGTVIGTITRSGSSTAYNTSSDYRLKTAVTYDWDATSRLKQLKPARFEWISDGDDAVPVDGFLAHEVQDIVPEAVTGTKDAMRDEEYEVTPAVLDEDGNEVTPAVMGTRSVPDYQGIDQSKLTPLLTKALIEAVEKIEELEARIAALETA